MPKKNPRPNPPDIIDRRLSRRLRAAADLPATGTADIVDRVQELASSHRKLQKLEALLGVEPMVRGGHPAGQKGGDAIDHVQALLQEQRDRDRELEEPIPLILFCPSCHERHIDEGEAFEEPHRTHACQFCGFLWAPSTRDTVGVRFLPGCKDV